MTKTNLEIIKKIREIQEGASRKMLTWSSTSFYHDELEKWIILLEKELEEEKAK